VNQSDIPAYTVIESPIFRRYADEVWSEDERHEFIDWISCNPLAGDVIAGTDDLRKVRYSRQGSGKRGGARVIYYNRLANGYIMLVVVYAKAKFDNLPISVLKQWKEALE
jgi:hypothetical protein